MRQVVVTGIGLVTSLGATREESWRRMVAGECGIRPVTVVESEADDLILEYTRGLYAPDFPALKAIILKDLFELNERVVDRCRDVGNVITNIVHKNA